MHRHLSSESWINIWGTESLRCPIGLLSRRFPGSNIQVNGPVTTRNEWVDTLPKLQV
jgi:hypothetical protein